MPFCFSLTLCQRLLSYQGKYLSLQTCHQKTYIYFLWAMDKNWLMQDSPGLKPDWFLLLRLASVPILAWVGRWILGGIYPSIMVLSDCIIQLQSLLIILHNLVPNFAWSFPSCRTINHQIFTFANPLFSFHPFYVTKPPELHLLHDHKNVLYS